MKYKEWLAQIAIVLDEQRLSPSLANRVDWRQWFAYNWTPEEAVDEYINGCAGEYDDEDDEGEEADGAWQGHSEAIDFWEARQNVIDAGGL